MNRAIMNNIKQAEIRRNRPSYSDSDSLASQVIPEASVEKDSEGECLLNLKSLIRQNIKVPPIIEPVDKSGRGRVKNLKQFDNKISKLDDVVEVDDPVIVSPATGARKIVEVYRPMVWRPPLANNPPDDMVIEEFRQPTPRQNTASSLDRNNHQQFPPLPKLIPHISDLSLMQDELAVSEIGLPSGRREAIANVTSREVQSERGYSTRKLKIGEDATDVSSANGQSETDCVYSLEEHLNKLADNLSQINKNHEHPNKEYIYKETYRFIKNFQRFEMDAELLARKLLGKYMAVIYSLLIQINDQQSDAYSKLLPEAFALVSKIKAQVLAYVFYRSNLVQVGQKQTCLQLQLQRL